MTVYTHERTLSVGSEQRVMKTEQRARERSKQGRTVTQEVQEKAGTLCAYSVGCITVDHRESEKLNSIAS